MVAKPKPPTPSEPGDLLAPLGVEELRALVVALQQQVREIQAENERLRAGAFSRSDEPVAGESEEERQRRIAGDPRVTVRRRPVGPVPPFEPMRGFDGLDILKLLGRREDEEDGAVGS